MKKLIILISVFLSFSALWAQENLKSVFDVARSGTVSELQELIKTNPNSINEINENGFTPLILACYRGNTDVAKILIDNVKDIDYRSQEGTALAAVSVKYNRDIAEYLLKKNANPNILDSTGSTPLFWAVKAGNVELVEMLIRFKANKNIKDLTGMTPFEYALQNNNTPIINLLKN